jgi:7-carboxy-7-deazaguanine synthase
VKVSEIFRSIQGESYLAGLPCTFVRLAGCNLRCKWCDTSYAWEAETACEMSVSDILEKVRSLGIDLVEITGGEPLLQGESLELMRLLCEAGARVLLETNGSRDVSEVDPRVSVVMDLKPPSAEAGDPTLWSNVEKLSDNDELKVIIAGRGDYEWARDALRARKVLGHYRVTFSPCFGMVDYRSLAEWLLADALPVRLGVQLHKIIWGPDVRGV